MIHPSVCAEENVIRNLLKQLLLPSTSISHEFESVYDDFCSQHKDLDKTIFTRQLLCTYSTYSSIYMMLDALGDNDWCKNLPH